MKRLIIRADDLGFSKGVNLGIAETIKSGLVRSVGVMTNMADTIHGLNLLKDCNVCLGQHTNICVGSPITDYKKIKSLCNENGEFKPSSEYRLAAKNGEDFVVLDEVILEIEAQYQQFKKLTGQEPKYFEGHAVASKNFFKGLEIVAKRHNLPYFAMAINQPVMFKNTPVHAYVPKDFNEYEKNPFNSLKDAIINAHDNECDLMVFHPAFIDKYLIDHSSMTITRAIEMDMLCNPSVKSWIESQNINLVTYDDLD